MRKEKDIYTLLKKITLVPNDQSLSNALSSLSPPMVDRPVRVAFVNAHAVNICWNDDGFLHHLIGSDYLFRDGSGMKILLSMLGGNPGLNLNGTDLIPRILNLYAGCDTILFGTKEPYLGRAANALQKDHITPVLTMDGFQKDEAYLQAARNQPARLIILAMGMPKQERIASLLAGNLDYPCLIICGGAILDFISGKVSRAPRLFRRLGIEWLYRLAQEPKRLFQRYVIGNFVFLFRGFLLSLKYRKNKLNFFNTKSPHCR